MKTKIFLAHVHKNTEGDLPPKGQMIIFQPEGGDAYIGGYDKDTGFWFDSDSEATVNRDAVIYWIPLSEVSPQWLYEEREKAAKAKKSVTKGEVAKRILSNYFYQSSTAAGLNWSGENEQDINIAVDDIIAAAQED